MSDLGDTLRSLDIIYSPKASNEDRKLATISLEDAKRNPQALSTGISLAQDRLRPPTVRHYGLSLLEYGLRYLWHTYTPEQAAQIRTWIVNLARDVNGEEPQFIRNKIAQLLEEAAECCWGREWQDFDQELCQLWDGSLAHKEVVLYALQTLSEKVFGKDEAAAGVRGAELGSYCVEIFLPLAEGVNGTVSGGLRYGQDGWLRRATALLLQCLQSSNLSQSGALECFTRSLSVLRSCVSWVALEVLADTDCVVVLCKCLKVENNQLQLLSLEVLHALYHRANYQKGDIERLACPLLSGEGVKLLKELYESFLTSIKDVDDVQYTCLRRLTEVICSLGTFIGNCPWLLENRQCCDYRNFVDLLVHILRSPSLAVSIPIIYLWTKLLSGKHVRHSEEFALVMGSLLEICSQRLIRYDMLPTQSDDITLKFLNEDFDTTPERHAFVGNYRRFCMTVIEHIVRKSPFDAMTHILTQSEGILRNLNQHSVADIKTHFATDSLDQLSVEAQFVVVNTATKSYVRWLQGRDLEDEQLRQNIVSMEGGFEKWCVLALSNSTQDPIIQKRVLMTVVELAIAALPSSSRTGSMICEQVLSLPVAVELGSDPYDEAVKDLETTQPKELQKLGSKYADQLYAVYGDLQTSINGRVSNPAVAKRLRLDYQAFLLTIVHHSTIPTEDERNGKINEMTDPLINSWQDPRLDLSTSDLQSFRNLLCLAEYPSYFLSRKAQSIVDWSSIALDDQGNQMREDIHHRIEDFPLQATRALLTVYTSQSRQQSPEIEPPQDQLAKLIPIVLPRMLPLLRLAHAFSNPDKWGGFPHEMRAILARTIQDRVWQNGISTESRDAFFARVRDSKASLEGLASAIRGAVRSVRELAMWILHSFSQLGGAFYVHRDLPEPLAQALYEDAFWLPPHQFSALLNLSANIIDNCPAEQREHFLSPLLIPLLTQLDSKLSSEWEKIERRKAGGGAEDNLEQEMKNESVLRNLTHSAAVLISTLFSIPAKGKHSAVSYQKSSANERSGQKGPASAELSVRGIVISSRQILEPLLLLSTHTLRMPDSRSCAIISRVLRSLVPDFQQASAAVSESTAALVREFFSTEVLKACITSINEPYYADLQKDLAALVASILSLYSPRTDTPRQVLASLAGMSEERISDHLELIRKSASERQQREWVLSLLDSVRGVSIHEQGRLEKAPKKSRTAMQEQFMAVDGDTNGGIVRGGSPAEGGIADLFG